MPPKITADVDVIHISGDLDPLVAMRELAGRLAQAHAEDRGNAPIARELRLTLSALIGLPAATDEDDPLAELMASLPPC
jgi:hypothetical protein